MSFQFWGHSPVWWGGWRLSMAAGRPSKEFDLVEVEKLGMLGTTAPEMAAWFNCSLRTIERRVGKLDGEFRRAYDEGFGRLKISLRREQIARASRSKRKHHGEDRLAGAESGG